VALRECQNAWQRQRDAPPALVVPAAATAAAGAGAGAGAAAAGAGAGAAGAGVGLEGVAGGGAAAWAVVPPGGAAGAAAGGGAATPAAGQPSARPREALLSEQNTLTRRARAPSAARMNLGGTRMTAPLTAHTLEKTRCSDSSCTCARTQAPALQLRPGAAGLSPVKLKVGRKMLLAGTWTAGAASVPAHGTAVTASGVLQNTSAARRGKKASHPAMTHAAFGGAPLTTGT